MAINGMGPLDEYPIHQAPLPVEWAASSDRNFYDRCYFNAHDRSGDIMLITGLGYYPNLGTKDAYFLVSRGGKHTALHFSDLIDGDRLNQHVGNYRLEVVEPMQKIRITIEETEGISADLTWDGTCPVVQELPHMLRSGSRVTLDAQRFAQLGTWSGTVSIDGEDIDVTPDLWLGSRDRSWGIRPVGEAEPAGAPANPPFEGMWWLYVPIQFDEYAVVFIIQEEPDGHRSLNDCSRVFTDGRVEQLGWPLIDVHYTSGTRTPTGATIRATTPDGTPLVLEVESRLAVPLHVGGGYGGDPDWTHGMWKGEKFTERLTYDMADDAVQGRFMFGCVDHVGRAVVTEGPDQGAEGFGLFEHFCIGRHDPTGFTDFFTLAP
ncbi:hypothetical protein [Nocardioides mangrovi]|uniref:Carotenoid 1,2-hydratase n=1 Tax=Nocardioides mangrovi TaxID=2874580 RepID=A0ABS7U977_9ACTN|nr:hypothetical protein [Nocardioides mangrovi]MBZ5737539.1 hypothetical protein [Nocardioides mangrovi]